MTQSPDGDLGPSKLHYKNPFPDGDSRHEAWIPFSAEVPESLDFVKENAVRTDGQVRDALQTVRSSPPEHREEIWKAMAPRLQELEPKRKWGEPVPSDEQLGYLLAPTGNPGTAAVFAHLETLAERAFNEFFRGGEDVKRAKQILQFLAATAFAVLGSDATESVRDGIAAQVQRWEEIAVWQARFWNIQGNGDSAQIKRRAEAYQRLAVHVLDVQGVKFDYSFQAADALLDSLHEHLLKIESPNAPRRRMKVIRSLCIATAEYCSELRTRSLKDGHAVEADVLGGLAQRYRDLLDRATMTGSGADLNAYRRVDTAAPEKVLSKTEPNPDPFEEMQAQSHHLPRRSEDAVPARQSAGAKRLFRKTGDFWTLAFGDREPVYVRDSKGMQYIAYLLQCPDQWRPCLELVAAARGENRLPAVGSGDDALDQTAVANYTSRREDLDAQLDEANYNQDQGRIETIYEEIQKLDEQLEKALGFGGRRRRISDDAERFRKGVSNSIKRAIEAVRKHHPGLADHLERRIDRGLAVRYCSDSISWEL